MLIVLTAIIRYDLLVNTTVVASLLCALLSLFQLPENFDEDKVLRMTDFLATSSIAM